MLENSDYAFFFFSLYSGESPRVRIDVVLIVVSYAMNMTIYIKGGSQAKGIWKQDPEANI